MKPTIPALCLALATCGATAATPPSAPASAASGASAAPVRATRAASAACAPLGASRPRRGHVVTSKVRHIPDESDPCADSTGVTPPLPR